MYNLIKDRTLIISLILLSVLLIILVLLTKTAMKNGVDSVVTESPAHFLPESTLKEKDQDSEYVSLVVRPLGNEPLVVTGWQIEGGANKYNLPRASPLFAQGKINEEVAVVIPREAKLIVSSGHSPLGVSFRENKCTGLLNTYQKFTPPLGAACSSCTTDTTYPEYNLCVEEHKGEADFFGNVWRLYLGSNKELWRNNLEVLKLYDQKGKLLDIKSF